MKWLLVWVIRLWALVRLNRKRWGVELCWQVKSAIGLQPRFVKIPQAPCLHLGSQNIDLKASVVFITWFIRTDVSTIYLFTNSKARVIQHLMETLTQAAEQDGDNAIVLSNAKRIEFLDSRHSTYPYTVWRGNIDLFTPTSTVTRQISPAPIDFLLVCGRDVVGDAFPPNSLRACEIFFASSTSPFTFQAKLFASLDQFAHSTQRLGK